MINVLIADDHRMVRDGLRRLLCDMPEIRVVGEASDGHSAMTLCRSTHADVLLLDIGMPGPGFLEVLHRLQASERGPRVLMLSMHTDEHYALRALRAGASGYLTKDASLDELERAIRQVYRGERYVSPILAQKLAIHLLDTPRDLPHEALSQREYQVMCMMGAGMSLRDIAEQIRVSPKTVSTYRMRVMEKMRLSSNAELVRYVVEQHLVD